MKDALLFLSSYRTWVVTVIAALLLSCGWLLLARRRAGPKEPHPVNQSGADTGGDIGGDTEASIAAREAGAVRIHRELGARFAYANVQIYIDEFDKLHRLHVAALRRDDAAEARHCLAQIHDLSRRLEYREFWDGAAVDRPACPGDFREELADRAETGRMIALYLGVAAPAEPAPPRTAPAS